MLLGLPDTSGAKGLLIVDWLVIVVRYVLLGMLVAALYRRLAHRQATMTTVLSKNVVSVRLFGSVARGDHDKLSDADILVVVEDRSGKVPEQKVKDYMESRAA